MRYAPYSHPSLTDCPTPLPPTDAQVFCGAVLPVEVLGRIAAHLEGPNLKAMHKALRVAYGPGIGAALSPDIGKQFMQALILYAGESGSCFVDLAVEGLSDAQLVKLDAVRRQALARIILPLDSCLKLSHQLRGNDHEACAQHFELLVKTCEAFLPRETEVHPQLNLLETPLCYALEALANFCDVPALVTPLQLRAAPDLKALILTRDAALKDCARHARELKTRIECIKDEATLRRAISFVEPVTSAVARTLSVIGDMRWLVNRI